MSALKLKLGRYDWASYASFCSYALCSLVIPLVIVEMGRDLGFPLDNGGMAAGGMLHLFRSIAIVIALLLCGFLAGKCGKRIAMGIASLTMGIGIFCCALTPCYGLLLFLVLIAGCGEGICEGVATPFVEALHHEAPERYVNIAHSMWSVGTALCVLVSGALLSFGVHWRLILAGCGLAALASALLFFWKERRGKEYPENSRNDSIADVLRYSAAIFRVPRFWVYCLGMFMGAGAEFCLTFWASAYLRIGFGASAWVGGLGTGAIACGMFLGRLGFGYYAQKRYLKHLLLACSLATIPLTLVLVMVKPGVFSSPAMLFAFLLIVLFFCGIGIAPYWPTLQVYGVDQLPELDSTMMFIYFSAMGIPGCGVFTWIMGVLGDRFGLQGAFLLIPGSLLLFALIVFAEGWLFPRRAGGGQR